MKWFANANDSFDERGREPVFPAPQSDAPSRKPSSNRLSSTFSESRPWNFITSSSSQPSDRSSLSSRKRRSLFGSRSSTTSSITPTAENVTLGHASPRPSLSAHSSARRDVAFSELDPFSASTASLSGVDSRRSSLFSRKTSTRLARASEGLARYGSNVKSSIDFRHRADEPDEAYGSSQSISDPITSRASTPKLYRKVKKDSISSPFNFQHVTHTQKDQLPELQTVADGGLRSEFWAAPADQASQSELRGIDVQSFEGDLRQRRQNRQQINRVSSFDSFTFRRGPLAGISAGSDQTSRSSVTSADVDAITPVYEARPSLSRESSSRSFTRSSLSSAERLGMVGAEHREHSAMVHPALRGSSVTPADLRAQTSCPIYELPAIGLHSVPEEAEVSPAKPPRHALTNTDESPPVSPAFPGMAARNTKFAQFPVGNAFAQAYGGVGADDQVYSSDEGSPPSSSSGEYWENDVDLLYLNEAESTCEFNWTSVTSSRKGSESSQNFRDSMITSSLRNTVHDDVASRPSSRRLSGKNCHSEETFAGFDGVSPSAQFLGTQRNNSGPPTSRRHSAISASSSSNVELAPIPESYRDETAVSEDDSMETLTNQSIIKHTRSASHNDQRPRAPQTSVRWSIASPLYLPEHIRSRQASFSSTLRTSLAEQKSFAAPLFPPPAAPLPRVPKTNPSGSLSLSPPTSPPTLSMPEFITIRRPSSPQDSALLHAAGRIVQRGRNARSSLPSRLSNVQNVQSLQHRTVSQDQATPLKMEPVHFQLSIFPTPPQSPPQAQQQYEEYPEWI